MPSCTSSPSSQEHLSAEGDWGQLGTEYSGQRGTGASSSCVGRVLATCVGGSLLLPELSLACMLSASLFSCLCLLLPPSWTAAPRGLPKISGAVLGEECHARGQPTQELGTRTRDCGAFPPTVENPHAAASVQWFACSTRCSAARCTFISRSTDDLRHCSATFSSLKHGR